MIPGTIYKNSNRLQIAMICHTTSGLFSRQSNGQMEITIQTVKSQLGKKQLRGKGTHTLPCQSDGICTGLSASANKESAFVCAWVGLPQNKDLIPKLFPQLQPTLQESLRQNRIASSIDAPASPKSFICSAEPTCCRDGWGGEVARQNYEVLLNYVSKIIPMHLVLNTTKH